MTRDGAADTSTADAWTADAWTADAWTAEATSLRRCFVFKDFAEAWAFMSLVADAAEALDHHPDWSNSWNRVEISLTSHDVGTVTSRDRALAEAIDLAHERVYQRRG